MLAINGGEKLVKKEFPIARRFEGNEIVYLKEALDQNTLFYASGKFVKRFNSTFAEMLGMKHCVAASSCTAAIHIALAALGVGIGDEVITPPITDMGGIIGILAQHAIPIFADVDPETYNITAESIEAVITPKTKAIIVTHLAGNPCEMDEIMAVARKHGVFVVEDCAQSYCAYYKGRLVGTFGDISCFSINEYKHITAGDGGMCLTNDDDLASRALLFSDKGYNRSGKTVEETRAVIDMAMNYRMTELQGAVGLAQLEKLNYICSSLTALGIELTKHLNDIPGIIPPKVMPHNISSNWFYMLRIDLDHFPCGPGRFADALNAEGVAASGGYIIRCVYRYEIFGEKYPLGLCPVAEKVLSECIHLKFNYAYGMSDIQAIAEAIRKIEIHRKEL